VGGAATGDRATGGHAGLLPALVWKAGRFGFPFGALLPLAVAGCAGASGG